MSYGSVIRTMRKWTDRWVREEAAFICAVRASNPSIRGADIMRMWGPALADEHIKTATDRAVALAFDAWDAASEEDFRENHEHWAAAEALLRTGWPP